ncbi:MAG TPA: GNAT family N-acetyltransferase [Gemmatales bacterium]|nr:GNAT family N-acetyltransferase [Gemmatales bacterium]
MIRAAQAEEMHLVCQLFLEYAQSLGFSLCFQGFQQELDELPGKYALRNGSLLLAWENDVAVGVVGLRRFDRHSAEMKRLYVRPDQRGKKLGRQLAEAIIAEAKRLGYSSIKLDTVPTMKEARQLYVDLGFVTIPAYYENSECESICMEKQITPE